MSELAKEVEVVEKEIVAHNPFEGADDDEFALDENPPAEKKDEPALLNSREELTLEMVFPREYTYYMVAGVLINTALLLFSHLGVSAQVFGSICPEDICPPIDITGRTDACLNAQDSPFFQPGQEGFDALSEYMSEIGTPCVGAETCMVEGLAEKFVGITRECSECLAVHGSCMIPCASSGCFLFPEGKSCQDCVENRGCTNITRTCTGVDFPLPPAARRLDIFNAEADASRSLQRGQVEFEDGCFEKEEIDRFPLVELTFFDSVLKALNGGSYFLAVLIVVASGIWPYTKNILIMACWFSPMTIATRDRILRLLAILGKWSLVDAFTVVLIISGAQIQKALPSTGVPLVIFTESRLGIYAFAIAAVWALFQGEVLRHLENKRIKQLYQHFEKRKPNKRQKRKLRRTRMALGLCSAISLFLIIIGCFTLNVEYTLSGKIDKTDGDNENNFTAVGLAVGMVDDCAIYDGHESIAGAYFLAFIFLMVVLVFPVVTLVCFYVVAMTFHHRKKDDFFIEFAFGVSNFAAVDVYLVCLLTVALQLEGLIKAAVGDNVNANCGVTEEELEQGITCLTLSGETLYGTYILLFGVLTFWASQMIAAYLMKKTHHYAGPIE